MSERPGMPSSTSFSMFIMRHGVSCANLTSKLAVESGWDIFGRMAHDAAMFVRKDPELTAYGRVKAQQMGLRMRRILEKEVGGQPIVVGASCLIRTQQTAYYMLQPNKMIIVPYISEVGPSGDNYPVTPEEQATILSTKTCGWPDFSEKRDFSYFDAVPNPRTPDPGKFINWLTKNYSRLVLREDGGLGTPLLFVSHGGFIRKLIFHLMAGEHRDTIHKSLFGVSDKPSTTTHEKHILEQYLNNYRAFKFDVTIHNIDSTDPKHRPTATITNISYLPYDMESPNRYVDNTLLKTEKECEVDTCRYRVCRSSRVHQADACAIAHSHPTLAFDAILKEEAERSHRTTASEAGAGTPYSVGGRRRTRKRTQKQRRSSTRKGR